MRICTDTYNYTHIYIYIHCYIQKILMAHVKKQVNLTIEKGKLWETSKIILNNNNLVRTHNSKMTICFCFKFFVCF